MTREHNRHSSVRLRCEPPNQRLKNLTSPPNSGLLFEPNREIISNDYYRINYLTLYLSRAIISR